VLVLNGKKSAGIRHRSFKFPSVAYKAGIQQQALDILFGITGDTLRVEIGEGAAIGFALAEDRTPGKPRLLGLEQQEFEVGAFIVHGGAPLFIVISHIQRIVSAP